MSQLQGPIAERRQSPRLVLSLWVEELYGRDIYFRRTHDISSGGAYFDRATGHPVGTRITLRIGLPNNSAPITSEAVVVGAHDNPQGLGMRVKFVNMDAASAARLQDFLNCG